MPDITDKEAKQIEMVYDAIGHAKDTIGMIYRPDGNKFANAQTDIPDETIKGYYYTLNTMCCELADRKVMIWQQEEKDGE